MEIIIKIAPDGTVETRVVGGCGKSCKDATKPLRDALGLTTEDRNLPEYHQQETEGDRVRSGRS